MFAVVRLFVFVSIFMGNLAHAKPTTIESIYQDALIFDNDLQNARGIAQEARGDYIMKLYAFLPAPLVTYDQERRDIKYKNGVSSVSHPGSFNVLITQNISAPKIFDTLSYRDASKGTINEFNYKQVGLLGKIAAQYSRIMTDYEGLIAKKSHVEYLKKIYDQEQQRSIPNPTNLNLAKSSYLEASTDFMQLKLNLQSKRDLLYTLTGKYYKNFPLLTDNKNLITHTTLKNISTYKDTAATKNESVKASKLKVKAEKLQLTATRGNFLPYFSYSFLYNKNQNQADHLTSQLIKETTQGSIGLAYDFGSNPGTVYRQSGTLMRAKASNRQVVAETLNNIQKNYEKTKSFKLIIKNLAITIQHTEETLQLMKNDYENGKISLFELLNSRNRLQQLKTNLAEARYELFGSYIAMHVNAGYTEKEVIIKLNALMRQDVNIDEL